MGTALEKHFWNRIKQISVAAANRYGQQLFSQKQKGWYSVKWNLHHKESLFFACALPIFIK